MLQIKNLSITHKKDLRTILEDFNFSLNKGDKVAIIGEEGNGKSTLLKWIYNPESVDEYTEAKGERICSGERFGYLPQELGLEHYEKSIYEFLSEEPLFWDKTPKELNLLTKQLQLKEGFLYEEQKMKTLSGGERIKVQMARIIIAEPTILLLDEPSNDIDIPTLEWLEKLINESERPVIYISHDETLIERTANVIIHLEQLRRKTKSRYTVSRTSYQEYITQRNAIMQNQTQQAISDRKEEKIRQEKLRKIEQKVEHAQNTVSRQTPHIGQLLKKKMKAVKSMEKRFEREAEDMAQMPETEEALFVKFGEEISIPEGKIVLDLILDRLETPKAYFKKSKTGEFDAVNISTAKADNNQANNEDKNSDVADALEVDEETRILSRNISLHIKGSKKICIIGRNGAGKSTLIKHIASKLINEEKYGNSSLKIAYMPQNYEDQLEMEKTPVEYLSVSGDKEELNRIRLYLASMKYTFEEMERPMRELSGGQKAKILLLKMSISGANVLVLDEPTRNFSPLSNPVIRNVLSGYGGTIISISHDRKYINEVCDEVYELTEEGLRKVRQ